jgi:DNA-binding response OmpR family regulator
MKVLIADDDRPLNQLLTTVLRAKGLEIVSAFDAMQALMFALRGSPDVIALDINMPGGTGLDALKKLKASVKTATVPVLVMSGSTDPKLAPQVKDLGADEFMQKPVNAEQFYRALCRLTGRPADGA